MSNARCLTEGVDVPTVDTVAFIDPKRSIIDIVQATGRALRKVEWKDRGYIFIPVVVDEVSEPEQLIESSDFETVWKVIQAMADQDQRLESIISKLRVMQGKGETEIQAWKDAMTEFRDKIDFYDLPIKYDKARFINNLYAKIVEVGGKSWDYWYGLTLKYKQENGDSNAPKKYTTSDGFDLGIWQGSQRANYKKGLLSSDRIRKLEEIGFVWDLFDEAFDKGIRESIKYMEQFGTPNTPNNYIAPNGYRLGKWQSHQRNKYTKGHLSQYEIQKLEEIGFIWDMLDEAFEKGFKETLGYKKQFGNPNTPNRYKTPDGYKLGHWQGHQRNRKLKGKLSQDTTKRFEEIGFVWNILDETFEKGFNETIEYKKQFGSPNAPSLYKTSDGYRLGYWQDHQKKYYLKGKLSQDRIKRLEEIGLIWNMLDKAFEKGFRETLKYKEQFGNANVSVKYKTPDGYKLGSWQSMKRIQYKKGIIASDRIKRLSEIGFVWDMLDEGFEIGFRETLKYKGQFSNPNTPNDYITPDGYKLGSWQSNWRTKFKKGKQSADQAKKLEEIGFIWNFLDEAFEKGFKETLEYKKQFGTPNAPFGYKTPNGFSLGKWQNHQKIKYNKGILLADKIKKFEEINFIWGIRDKAFEKGFKETLKYKELFCNPDTPFKYKTPDGYRLGKWQSHQRNNYSKGKLSLDRVKRLEEIGFKWKLTDIQRESRGWDFWFELTLQFKQETGDANTLSNYHTSSGFNLGGWQNRQRIEHKKGTLSADKAKRLDKIKFRWSILDEKFEKGFRETLEYKKQFGNPNTPFYYKTPDGYALGKWQSHQRYNYLKGKLSQDRVNKLEEIGFVRNILDESFEKGLSETVLYNKQFGKSNAPARHKTPDGFNLGTWQNTQKANYKKGILSSDRINKLEGIGFKWKLTNVKPKKQKWETWFEVTLEFKRKTGYANAPTTYQTSNGFNLGTWQGSQRANYKKGTLSLDRIKKLEGIGFIWNTLDEAFEEGFRKTLEYKKQFGNPNTPYSYKTPDGYKLGFWQSNRRKNYLKGNLSQDRIKRLEDLGFKWSLR
jgi:hypothetical protein